MEPTKTMVRRRRIGSAISRRFVVVVVLTATVLYLCWNECPIILAVVAVSSADEMSVEPANVQDTSSGTKTIHGSHRELSIDLVADVQKLFRKPNATNDDEESSSNTTTTTTAHNNNSHPAITLHNQTTVVIVVPGQDIYTSSCSDYYDHVDDVDVSNNSTRNSTHVLDDVTKTSHQHVVAFQYEMTLTNSAAATTNNNAMDAYKEPISYMEMLLHNFLSSYYLGNCSRTTLLNIFRDDDDFTVTSLSSAPLDITMDIPCANNAPDCTVVDGYVTVNVLYDTRRHRHYSRRMDDKNVTDSTTIPALTDLVVAESVGTALDLFFQNATALLLNSTTTTNSSAVIAHVEYLAITNLVLDQPTFDGVDDTSGGGGGAASGILRDSSSPAENGSVSYSWGAVFLGGAGLALICTAFFAAVRFHQQRRRAIEVTKVQDRTVDEDEPEPKPVKRRKKKKKTNQLPGSSHTVASAKTTVISNKTKKATKEDTLSDDEEAVGVVATYAPNGADGSIEATMHPKKHRPRRLNDVERQDLPPPPTDNDDADDMVRKNVFVLGDDYWDDLDDDDDDDEDDDNVSKKHKHTSDKNKSTDKVEVVYDQGDSPTNSGYIQSLLLRRIYTTRNSNPPQFVATEDDDEEGYDPYGPKDLYAQF